VQIKLCCYACAVDEDHPAKLTRWREEVSIKLESQSVASYMFNCQALNKRDLESITSRRNEPIRAAEELLDIVKSRPYTVYVCFLDALKETEHQDVHDLIRSGDRQGTTEMTVCNTSGYVEYT